MSRALYRVRFRNEDKIFELYARSVAAGELFGFIEISQLVWGKKSTVIIDPTEQELRNEFSGVKRFQVPMHAVIRIDEVEKSGSAKVLSMPRSAKTDAVSPLYPPRPEGK